MRTGELNTRIKIYKTVETTTSTGEEVEQDVLFKKAWAKIQDGTGAEKEEEKIITLDVRKYIIRFNAEVFKTGEKMKIKSTDGWYSVNNVALFGRNQFLILKTSKRE